MSRRRRSDSSLSDMKAPDNNTDTNPLKVLADIKNTDNKQASNEAPREGVWRYIITELTHGYELNDNEQIYSEKQRRVSTFMKTPRELEKLMLFGFFICLDAFLFLFTVLPVRFLLATFSILFRFMFCSKAKVSSAHLIDIIRVLIFGFSLYFLSSYVDISTLYHVIRAQSVIKLYVIYNMLEIFDRLLASIGQDTLDTLYWLVADYIHKKRSSGHFTILFYLFIATFYVFIHTNVILVQATTLSVAINSHSKALLTIMVSNNFVELKGSVFKKFEIRNLFQMSCSDIRERFHYVLLMLVVILRNFSQLGDLSHLQSMLPIVVMVIVSEVFVDCVKHAFITKFNNISPDVYKTYRLTLAKDLTDSRSKRATSEHSDLVSRRMGFIPLPLGCLLVRTIAQSVTWSEVSLGRLLVCTYVCLMAVKMVLGITLLKLAQHYHTETLLAEKSPSDEANLKSVQKVDGAEPLQRRSSVDSDVTIGSKIDLLDNPKAMLKEKAKTSLSDVERFTLCSNRIV